MEFKFTPNLKDKRAQKDIQKFQELKKYHESIKRVYFFSIDTNTDLYRYIFYRGSWYEKFYREGRGVPDKDRWNFYILKPEEEKSN